MKENRIRQALRLALVTALLPFAVGSSAQGAMHWKGTVSRAPEPMPSASSAIDWMAERHPEVPLVVAGFSFGAWTGLPVGCADSRVSHVVGLGTPLRAFNMDMSGCLKPKLFVHGTNASFSSSRRSNVDCVSA